MRPRLFVVLFWLAVPGIAVVHLIGAPTYPLHSNLVPLFVLLVVLVALWQLLPWDLAHRRPWVAVAFLVVCALLAFVDGSGLVAPLLLVGLGNIAQVFGTRWAYAVLGALLVEFFVLGLGYTGADWTDALRGALVVGVLCAFGIHVAAAVRTARVLLEELDRREEEIRRLAVAEERARMAREMHDSLGHYLTVIKVGLENAERLRSRAPDRSWEEVRDAKTLTMQALADTRRAVRALRPLALEDRRGSAALSELARTFDGTGVTVELVINGAERDLGPDAEIVLYRVFQEGLTNVLKHAGASTATAELSFPASGTRLVISDDGRGADPVTPGFGLDALSDRVRELGGTFSAGNRAAGGFELRVELPA